MLVDDRGRAARGKLGWWLLTMLRCNELADSSSLSLTRKVVGVIVPCYNKLI